MESLSIIKSNFSSITLYKYWFSVDGLDITSLRVISLRVRSYNNVFSLVITPHKYFEKSRIYFFIFDKIL